MALPCPHAVFACPRIIHGVCVEREAIPWFEVIAYRGDIEVRQHPQDRLHFNGSRRVSGSHTQAIRAQSVDAEEHEPVVAAEVGKLVGPPQAAVIVSGTGRRNQRNVDQTEGGGILEKQAKKVAFLLGKN